MQILFKIIDLDIERRIDSGQVMGTEMSAIYDKGP